MQIVIEIDDNLYTRLFDNGVDNYDDAVDMAKTIRKGTPLPKGHGRLIDADKVTEAYFLVIGDFIKVLDSVPTIIEADKEVENDSTS